MVWAQWNEVVEIISAASGFRNYVMQVYDNIKTANGALLLELPKEGRFKVGARPLVVTCRLLYSILVETSSCAEFSLTRAIRVDKERFTAVLALLFDFGYVLRFLCLIRAFGVGAIRATTGAVIWAVVNLGSPTGDGFATLSATGDDFLGGVLCGVSGGKVAGARTILCRRFVLAGTYAGLEFLVAVGAINHSVTSEKNYICLCNYT